jgi:phosphoglycerate dehydrogenase-like enzyme
MKTHKQPVNIFISTPLEQVHADRIGLVAPDFVTVNYNAALLPPARYTADHKGSETFVRSTAQEEQWRASLAVADILWDFPPLSADGSGGFSLAPNVKWVQTTSSGVGQLVKTLGLQESDLLITTARGIHARPLTDFVFLGLLSHYKQRRHLELEQRAHCWKRYCGEGLANKTLAVIGTGVVGHQVMAVGRAFGMRVVALARSGSSKTAVQLGADKIFPPSKLHDMLTITDALVLSVPHTPGTEGLIDRKAIAALKPGAVFVNVARGQIVDEDALTEALGSGHIAFAALDVFTVEPLPESSLLWDMSNVLISPHSASTVAEENQMIADIFCHNLRCYVDGRLDEMTNVLDKPRMY